MKASEIRLTDPDVGDYRRRHRLPVYDIDVLQVIAATGMPAVTSTTTNPPTVMIAENDVQSSRVRLGKHWQPNPRNTVNLTDRRD